VSEHSLFSERGFYLDEFRGRTLGIFVSTQEQAEHPGLLAVLDELRANRSRVVLVTPAGLSLSGLDCEVLSAGTERLEGRLWRRLRSRWRVVVEGGDHPFSALLDVARRLALFKVIRLADVDGVEDEESRRRSFVDLAELEDLIARSPPPLLPLLRQVESLLQSGVPNVNLCTVAGLHDELFTYSGSGTLFTRERYVVTRKLGVDDYDAAENLVARGVAEGYLVPRDESAIDRLLADGFGAFVEGKHLAGIGALLVPADARAGEVASLYTLTRFVGEGVGSHLVSYAIARARDLDLGYVYACTTSGRVGEFFERLGFAAVGPEEVPAEKWRDYDPERRSRVRCFRRDL
jgi:amino-acid N-acetyltransferase